ncbi:hypothetical protein OIU84_020406 [Salix udensis]|nr:hypothetical protein OIU84_020406 [Salix udensis]
MVSFVS